MIDQIVELEEEVIELKEEIDSLNEKVEDLEDEVSRLENESGDLKDEIVLLEEEQKEDGTIDFPYVYVNDQFKCNLLLENWDKFKEEDIEEMLKGKR